MTRRMSRVYSTRASAVRAARAACRRLLDSPIYEAAEGPDYEIHPDLDPFDYRWNSKRPHKFCLRGPAAEVEESETFDLP